MRLRLASYNIHKCLGLDRRRRPDRVLAVMAGQIGLYLRTYYPGQKQISPGVSGTCEGSTPPLGPRIPGLVFALLRL